MAEIIYGTKTLHYIYNMIFRLLESVYCIIKVPKGNYPLQKTVGFKYTAKISNFVRKKLHYSVIVSAFLITFLIFII